MYLNQLFLIKSKTAISIIFYDYRIPGTKHQLSQNNRLMGNFIPGDKYVVNIQLIVGNHQRIL